MNDISNKSQIKSTLLDFINSENGSTEKPNSITSAAFKAKKTVNVLTKEKSGRYKDIVCNYCKRKD